MAWTYTKPNANSGWGGGGVQITWDNEWSVEELTPTQAGFIRLRVSVRTNLFYVSPWQYACYTTDTIRCGSESVTVQEQTRVGSNYGYVKEVQVPNAWAGQTVTLDICWSSRSVASNLSWISPFS